MAKKSQAVIDLETKEDHSRRDVCDKAFSWLLQHEREEQAN